MNTTKLTYATPGEQLPHGWKTGVARDLALHRNTVKEAIKRGGDDPTFLRIMKYAAQKYFNPINVETT